MKRERFNMKRIAKEKIQIEEGLVISKRINFHSFVVCPPPLQYFKFCTCVKVLQIFLDVQTFN